MGFLGLVQRTETTLPKGLSLEFLHRHGCQVCPLYKTPGNCNPDMQPTGAKRPLVYILGEAPGETEDRKGIQFCGKAGRVLRSHIPKDWLPAIRWNNVVRTRPPKNRDPSQVEIEACRPSIIADIEKTKPTAIFGFGNVPLHWALKETGITTWKGKRIPVKIGKHTCWFYPMLHPSYIMRKRNERFANDLEFVFKLDLQRALNEVESLPDPVVHNVDDVYRNFETITGDNPGDFDRVYEVLEEMSVEEYVGLDYETSALRPYAGKILTMGLASEDRTVSFAIDHDQAGWSDKERIELKRKVKEFLHDAPCRKVAYNLAFEMEWSGVKFGQDCLWGSRWADAMLQAYVLDPLRADPRNGRISLEALVLQYFGINIKDLADVNRKNLAAEPLDKVLRYNGPDARYALLLYLAQRKDLARAKLKKVYARQLKRIPTMVLTQIKGVPIDKTVVAEFAEQYGKRVNRREAELMMLPVVRKFKKIIGHPFNPGSNPDVKKLVTEVLDIPLDGGVDENVLKTIKHPFSKALLAWRKATKLESTYVLSAKPGRIWPDGLLHPVINTMKVVTSRTSSDGPNVQNWPHRGPGTIVRRQIKPQADWVIVAVDYAGIQARNVAMESNDEKLVKAFWHHYDIHGDFTERLARMYPKFFEEGGKAVAKDKALFKAYRNKVKNRFVFPSFFGSVPKSVAKGLGVPQEIGEKLQEAFWGDFADVHIWHKKLRAHYAKHGWIAGLSGFRHTAPIAFTEIINYPIQADEAVIVCEAQTNLSKRGDEYQANLMIHDDLTFAMPKKEVDKRLPVILEEMLRINFDWINVPLEAEVKIGPDWFELSDAGKYESRPNGGYRELK